MTLNGKNATDLPSAHRTGQHQIPIIKQQTTCLPRLPQTQPPPSLTGSPKNRKPLFLEIVENNDYI
jgi:hypothetical protein